MKSKLSFKTRGGIRLGKSYWNSSNTTWPFAKIEIFKEKLIINSIFHKIDFNKREITYIEEYQGLLDSCGRGIRIHHKKVGIYPFIIFWHSSPEKILNILKNLGYKI